MIELTFYSVPVTGQLSLFSADTAEPTLTDLAGVLCGHGQLARFALAAARLSVVVEEEWRAVALAAELDVRGVAAEVARSGSGHPLVRTAFLRDLGPLAEKWTRGAVKAVPKDFRPDGPSLRLWAMSAGRRDGQAYLLDLDPRAPDTHRPLADALVRAGLRCVLRGPRATPAVQVSGKRRLAALAGMMGEPPPGGSEHWPI